jgi:16S rRNA (cytidine1402-2'-O)-methyltransferase
MAEQGTLYLIPVPVSGAPVTQSIPEFNLGLVRTLKKFITENNKEARKFLKAFGYPKLEEAELRELNTHSKAGDLGDYLKFIKGADSVGLMSDAGCPGIADPGAEIVKLAHQHNIPVMPLVGPSSIVLGIMASGFNGQNFAFNGYLPIDKTIRQKRLKELEHMAVKYHQAQFFIETPYRNQALYDHILQVLAPDTLLFVGRDVQGEHELLKSKSIQAWRQSEAPELHKFPTIFGIYN